VASAGKQGTRHAEHHGVDVDQVGTLDGRPAADEAEALEDRAQAGPVAWFPGWLRRDQEHRQQGGPEAGHVHPVHEADARARQQQPGQSRARYQA
jgi:hypothetical protein